MLTKLATYSFCRIDIDRILASLSLYFIFYCKYSHSHRFIDFTIVIYLKEPLTWQFEVGNVINSTSIVKQTRSAGIKFLVVTGFECILMIYGLIEFNGDKYLKN